MGKYFYKSGFISSSIMLPFVGSIIYTTNGKWWGLIPLTVWWTFTGLGLLLKWGD